MKRDGKTMTNEHLEEGNRLFEQAMAETIEKINVFEKTFWYRQLNYSEQMMARQIILSFSEFMFDYHFQTLHEWQEYALQDVLLDIFPHEFVAGNAFFEKSVVVLTKFFEFLHFHESFSQGLQLAKKTQELKDLMLSEVDSLNHHTPEAELIRLGEELGLDTSSLEDMECLYRLAEIIQQDGIVTQNVVPMKKRKV